MNKAATNDKGQVVVTHNGTEIVYVESHKLHDNDHWLCTIRGRERRFGTLTEAKTAIDKPDPKKDGPDFNPRPAYYKLYSKGFVEVRITSIAEGRYGGAPEFWISYKENNKTQRQKERGFNLFQFTLENKNKVDEINKLRDQIASLHEKIQNITDTLKPFQP